MCPAGKHIPASAVVDRDYGLNAVAYTHGTAGAIAASPAFPVPV